MTPTPWKGEILHTDGEWHLVVTSSDICEVVGWVVNCDSVVYHLCSKAAEPNENTNLWGLAIQYRITSHELGIPCHVCHETVPEGLRGLWMLHNYDSIRLEATPPAYTPN